MWLARYTLCVAMDVQAFEKGSCGAGRIVLTSVDLPCKPASVRSLDSYIPRAANIGQRGDEIENNEGIRFSRWLCNASDTSVGYTNLAIWSRASNSCVHYTRISCRTTLSSRKSDLMDLISQCSKFATLRHLDNYPDKSCPMS